MRRVPLTVLLIGAFALLLPLGSRQRAAAQPNGNFQKVKFESPDGVELNGYWYPSPKAKAPCVMILHPLGEDCSKPEWTNLAKTLQKDGFAVLLFDFRGHGGSTNIANPQAFWAYNKKIATPQGKGDTIDFKDYKDNAYTVFVNDIAGAKAFLDIKNDAGDCNSSALVLIGADTGATLGSIWMNSEFYRFRFVQPNPPFVPGGVDLKNPAGKNIMAAIWLSISGKLGKNEVIVPKVLLNPVKTNAVPTVFMYNDKIMNEKKLAEYCDTNLKGPNKAMYKFTGATAVNAPGMLSGRELLSEDLDTHKNISKYLDSLNQDARANSWVEQEFKKTNYVWAVGNKFVPTINTYNNKTFKFFDYSVYSFYGK